MTIKELKAALEGVADDTPVEVIAANHFHPVKSAHKGFINRLGAGEEDGPVFVIGVSTNPAEFIHQAKKWREQEIRDIVRQIEGAARALDDLAYSEECACRVWRSEGASTEKYEQYVEPYRHKIEQLHAEREELVRKLVYLS